MKVKCNWCESIFNEDYIIEKDHEEMCPCCKKVGYLADVKETENYIKFSQEIFKKMSVNELVWFDKVVQGLNPSIHSIIKSITTEKKCPRCGKTLYCSDLPEYDYVCVECNENFYECEVE